MATTVRNHGSDPVTNHYTVSTSNTVPLSPTPRSIYVTTDGTLTVVDQGNVAITYSVTAGQVLPFRALRIHTDSTATSVAWY